MRNFSVSEYCYRDASNYKSWWPLLLLGRTTNTEVEILRHQFGLESHFIAEQLCIPALYAELWVFTNGPVDDDHVWHTFDTLRPATAQDMETPIFGTLAELIQKIEAVKAWDETLSPHWGI